MSRCFPIMFREKLRFHEVACPFSWFLEVFCNRNERSRKNTGKSIRHFSKNREKCLRGVPSFVGAMWLLGFSWVFPYFHSSRVDFSKLLSTKFQLFIIG